MATQNYFAHTGSDGSGLEDRAANNGFYTFPLGENIAAGYISIQSVVLAWMWYVPWSPLNVRQRPPSRHHAVGVWVAWLHLSMSVVQVYMPPLCICHSIWICRLLFLPDRQKFPLAASCQANTEVFPDHAQANPNSHVACVAVLRGTAQISW